MVVIVFAREMMRGFCADGTSGATLWVKFFAFTHLYCSFRSVIFLFQKYHGK